MAKYLKTSFIRNLEIQLHNEEISYNKMLELIQEEVIKNYKEDNTFRKKSKRFFSDIWLGIKISNNIKENNQIF